MAGAPKRVQAPAGVSEKKQQLPSGGDTCFYC